MPTERFTFTPLAFIAGSWEDAPLAERTAPTEVRLLTWNVWFGGHMFDERRDALFAELARRAPDVIVLQEVTDELLVELLDEPWVQAAYQLSERQLEHYDVVVLSRLPIRRLSVVELPSEMGRRLLVAELACGLTIATVHLESTRHEAAARAAQLRIIQPALLERSPDVLLAGDMNFEPDHALENAALDPSFVDTWPLLHPEAPGYTVDTAINVMRLQTHGKPAQKRIDRIFARSSRWRARAIELVGTAPIDRAGTFTSDHFGLEARFTVGP